VSSVEDQLGDASQLMLATLCWITLAMDWSVVTTLGNWTQHLNVMKLMFEIPVSSARVSIALIST
jgi:hypothetical protein